MAGWAGMAKLIEDLLRIDLHQVDILYEEPQVLIKGRCVDGVYDRHEGSPILVVQLNGFLFELSLAQLIHETSSVNGLLPTPLQLGFFLRDQFLGFSFRALEHPRSPS